MAELTLGERFAAHEIRGVAGRGGMGIVYRALDLRLKREVALKVIAPASSKDPEFRTRFQRECEVAASIHHPNLIPVYTAGEEDGHLYVTMRFVEGRDLAHLLKQRGQLETTSAAALIAQVGAALDAAHAYGIVHRDVKPANVLLDGEHALLTDFGLQRDIKADTRVTEPGTLIGTFDYIAPEQLEDGAVDARTDVYALGCVLYETLTGEVPFPVETPAAKMFAHLGAPPPSVIAKRPEAGDLLEAVVQRAMSKDPSERYASAGELGLAALEAVAGGGPATQVSPAPPKRELRIPLPPALIVECGRQPFVGRTEVRARLAARHAAAADGERQFVLITGEPGIGKTRLASEAARAAHDAGRDRPLRPRGRGVAGPLPAVRQRAAALRRQPPRPAPPAGAGAGALRARPLHPGPAALAAARRRAGDRPRGAPLPALRGGHAAARPRRPRTADRADPRRHPVGRRLDLAAARARAAGHRADAAARARHDARQRDRPGRAARAAGEAAPPVVVRPGRRWTGSTRRSWRRSSACSSPATSRRASCAGCATAPRATRSSSRRRCARWARSARSTSSTR